MLYKSFHILTANFSTTWTSLFRHMLEAVWTDLPQMVVHLHQENISLRKEREEKIFGSLSEKNGNPDASIPSRKCRKEKVAVMSVSRKWKEGNVQIFYLHLITTFSNMYLQKSASPTSWKRPAKFEQIRVEKLHKKDVEEGKRNIGWNKEIYLRDQSIGVRTVHLSSMDKKQNSMCLHAHLKTLS